MKAIVAGPTGLVGSVLVKELLADPYFSEVIVYARRPLPFEDNRLKVIIGELGQMNSHREELRGDVYFSCLGTTIKTAVTRENFRKVDFHGVVSLGRIAFSHKAKTMIVVSASGANSQSRIFYSRVKGETEKALKDLGLRSLVIFRPGLLVGKREEKRRAEQLSIKAFGVLRHLMPHSLSLSLGTDVEKLVKRMVDSARTDKAGVEVIEAREI